MVFNPPALKDEDKKEEPVVVTISPARSGDAYVEQAKRGAGWVSLLLIGWLFQRLLCEWGLPSDCDLPRDALEVLTDLVTLMAFGLAQAWFCEVLEDRRFRHLTKEAYFGPVYAGMILAVSAIQSSQWFEDMMADSPGDWSESHIIVTVFLVAITIFFVAWHFAEAWRVLPGAYYVSGQVNIHVVIKENLHRIYNVSRGLIVTYALLYAAFAFDEKDGLGQHYVVLAWVLSLLAQFKSKPSIIWLAVCTGVFVQGVGAFRLRFLCATMGNDGNGFGVDGDEFRNDDRGNGDDDSQG